MTSTTDSVLRVIRGIIGLILVIAGIMNESLISLLGIFFLMTAIRGGCGAGSVCEVKPQKKIE